MYNYLSEGRYPDGFSKSDKQALRKRVKFFSVKDAHLYYIDDKLAIYFSLILYIGVGSRVARVTLSFGLGHPKKFCLQLSSLVKIQFVQALNKAVSLEP